MKRHPSLAHLSRDHHAALLLARLLQTGAPPYKTLPTTQEGKATYAKKFYEDELVKHFAAEEKAFALLGGIGDRLDEYIKEIVDEHRLLRNLFGELAVNDKLPVQLDNLGKLLEIHIRKEERQLFPLIEQSCSEATLAEVEAILVANGQ